MPARPAGTSGRTRSGFLGAGDPAAEIEAFGRPASYAKAMVERDAACSCGQRRLVARCEPVRGSVRHCMTRQRRTGGALACAVAGSLRAHEPPVVGIIGDGRLLLDCGTLTDAEGGEIAAVVRRTR